MSQENISLFDLLNLSIGTPQRGAVNFSALHVLLHAVLRHLDLQEVTTRWTDTPPGDGHPDAAVGVTAAGEGELSQPGTEPQQRTVGSRIRTCEDGVTEALKLIQELHDQANHLKGEIEQLHLQQKMVGAQAEKASAVEQCCHRVDDLENTVRSLSDTFQTFPEPEELSRCVTWDVLHSALLRDTEHLQQGLVQSGAVNPPRTSGFSSPLPVQDSCRPSTAERSFSVQEESDSQLAKDSPSVLSGGRGMPLAGKISSSERHLEALEILRDISKLREKFCKLEARVTALEEGKVDRVELAQLKELISNHGSHEVSNDLMDQLRQQRASLQSLMSEREENLQLVSDVQKTFLQLQAECEKLDGSSKRLQEDSRRSQRHIEELFKATEELQDRKADRLMVESEIKADKTALEGKVSRVQFESATEQLGTMIRQLLDKVSVQEQDWHRVVRKLSTEMDCKLNRIELDSVKKQLDGRWRNITEKLQAQEAAELDDAAVLRKQLVDRFHCLSCDRPVVKYSPEQHLVTLPSTPGFPAHRPIRPFTVYALEQFRQHYRSERISGLADYGHMTVSRSCGGSHTVNPASQRRHATKPCTHTEVDVVIQSEEVDIVGLDGHIYKGRLNTPVVRNPENKLPTISTKDGLCKSKPSRPMTSPEVGPGSPLHHPQNAKNAQCSRSASSSSARDWPVSALGCTSRSSVTQDAEHRADQSLDH